MQPTSQQQGAEFERSFQELLGRLLTVDLGLTLLQNSLQSSGIQYGKDIQTKWLDSSGRECFWHFECKSHKEGVLHQKEVVDKILDCHIASHSIQVWCLALANIEPGNWIDDRMAWANEHLNLPFHLEVLSPNRGFIRSLFACYPDLFAQAYPTLTYPQPDSLTRAASVQALAAFVAGATERGRQQALRPRGEWEVISRYRLQTLPDDVDRRRAYLRGLTSCPWEAVVHGWTVTRASAERPILADVVSAQLGLSIRCVVGAGGEGKSTLLKRIVWRLANAEPGWIILWRNVRRMAGPAPVPLDWLESLSDGSRVLLCCDGTRHVGDIEALTDAHWRLRQSGKRLYLLMADRGHIWSRSAARRALAVERRHPDAHKYDLGPLDPQEQRSIAELLDHNGLLYGKSIDEAIGRLKVASSSSSKAANQSFLLPTLMQLTDPEDRGFETILESVLTDLAALTSRASLRIILATAMFHASSLGLPSRVARAVAGSSDAAAEALYDLDAEIQKQFGLRIASSSAIDSDQYFVHHAVVADGLLIAAGGSTQHRQTLLSLCEEVPGHICEGMDLLNQPLSPEAFFLLDAIPTHLDSELQIYEAAVKFLSAWYLLDPRGFPALHRSAECYTRWLQAILKHQPTNDQLAQVLYANATDAYSRTITVAARVLSCPGATPWFKGYQYRECEFKAFHGRAVVEGSYGAHVQDRSTRRATLLRSVMLSLLAFEPGRRNQNARACSTLSLTLINLGYYAHAARVTAASIQFGSARRIVEHQINMLSRHGTTLPSGGVELLDEVLGSLIAEPLQAEWQSIALYKTWSEHGSALVSVLDRAIEWLPVATRVTATRQSLSDHGK